MPCGAIQGRRWVTLYRCPYTESRAQHAVGTGCMAVSESWHSAVPERDPGLWTLPREGKTFPQFFYISGNQESISQNLSHGSCIFLLTVTTPGDYMPRASSVFIHAGSVLSVSRKEILGSSSSRPIQRKNHIPLYTGAHTCPLQSSSSQAIKTFEIMITIVVVVCTLACTWSSEDSSLELALSFCLYVGSNSGNYVVKQELSPAKSSRWLHNDSL